MEFMELAFGKVVTIVAVSLVYEPKLCFSINWIIGCSWYVGIITIKI